MSRVGSLHSCRKKVYDTGNLNDPNDPRPRVSSMVMRRTLAFLAGLSLAVLLSMTPAGARSDTGFANGGVVLLPEESLYAPYLASLRFPEFRFGYLTVSDDSIAGTEDTRWDLRAGRHVPLIRFGEDWQFGAFGGLKALFDAGREADNVAWDGVFGLSLSRRLDDARALRLEYEHQSAHLGDELVARTGRTRIEYSRQEISLGYSSRPSPRVRLYAEGGWGFDLTNETLQEPWRGQAGLEVGIPRTKTASTDHLDWGPFLAVDLESMQERNWGVDTTVQAGIYGLRQRDVWRFGLEFRDGRIPYGEFSFEDETYVGVALWTGLL